MHNVPIIGLNLQPNRALYRGGFGNNEMRYFLTNNVTGEKVEVCRGRDYEDYLKARSKIMSSDPLKM